MAGEEDELDGERASIVVNTSAIESVPTNVVLTTLSPIISSTVKSTTTATTNLNNDIDYEETSEESLAFPDAHLKQTTATTTPVIMTTTSKRTASELDVHKKQTPIHWPQIVQLTADAPYFQNGLLKVTLRWTVLRTGFDDDVDLKFTIVWWPTVCNSGDDNVGEYSLNKPLTAMTRVRNDVTQ